jgi:flagellar hook-associated protein 1 FlgK
MASQFFGLNIAYTGLLASNASLNTSANNISNVETEGYSRQEVTQTAAEALRSYTTFGCTGAGVDVSNVERVRDEFYDKKYWINNKEYGEYEMKAYYMNQIQDYFVDDTSVKGFSSIFNEMFSSLAELQKSSGDSTLKSQFTGYARNLTTYFNEMASNLSKIQEDINEEIKVKCNEINSYAEEIASLNKQITVIELTGVTANELRDQRTLIVDKLSKIVDVQTFETPITDEHDPTRKTGAYRFRVTIAGNQTLVDMNDYNTLACVAKETGNKAYQSDIAGLYEIKWSNGADFGMYNASMGGELAGLVQMRDGNNGEYFHGTVSGVNYDKDGNALVKIAVTNDYLEDINKSTLNNTGVINVGNTLYKYSEWSFDLNTHEYTFKIDVSENEEEITQKKVGKEASVNQRVEYQGIPYYQTQLNEWVRAFAKAFNGILTQTDSYDELGNPGVNLFTANLANATQSKFKNEDSVTGVITSQSDCYRQLTASNFGISDLVAKNPDRLATHTVQSDGQDKYDVIRQLTRMKSDQSVMSFRGGSAQDFLESMLAEVALNTERATTFSDNAEARALSVSNQRESISGVDREEETVKLVKYQHAYNLSSKVIQVLSEVYNRLILETGV